MYSCTLAIGVIERVEVIVVAIRVKLEEPKGPLSIWGLDGILYLDVHHHHQKIAFLDPDLCDCLLILDECALAQ